MNVVNRGWESIYAGRGAVQVRPLEKVSHAIQRFRELNLKTVLDLGCGTGRHALLLAQCGFTVSATDISPTGVSIAEQSARTMGLDSISFGVHEMTSLPFPDGTFDAVLSTLVIDHGTVAEIARTIREVFRVLRSGGLFVTDLLSVDDVTYGRGVQIEAGTFLGSISDEPGIVHHYCTRSELVDWFADFATVKIEPCKTLYGADVGNPHYVHSFDVEAVK